MSVTLRFRAEDLLQCRFAISPLGETADALRSLVMPGREGYNLPWQRQVRRRLPELGIGPLLAVLAMQGYQPDFLCPPPPGPFTEIDAELDRVRAAGPERVAAELDLSLGSHPAGRAARRAQPGAVRRSGAGQGSARRHAGARVVSPGRAVVAAAA